MRLASALRILARGCKLSHGTAPHMLSLLAPIYHAQSFLMHGAHSKQLGQVLQEVSDIRPRMYLLGKAAEEGRPKARGRHVCQHVRPAGLLGSRHAWAGHLSPRRLIKHCLELVQGRDLLVQPARGIKSAVKASKVTKIHDIMSTSW